MFRDGLREGAGLEAGARECIILMKVLTKLEVQCCVCVCVTQKIYTNLEVRTKAVF